MGDVDPGVARTSTGISMRTPMDKVDLGEARTDTGIYIVYWYIDPLITQ